MRYYQSLNNGESGKLRLGDRYRLILPKQQRAVQGGTRLLIDPHIDGEVALKTAIRANGGPPGSTTPAHDCQGTRARKSSRLTEAKAASIRRSEVPQAAIICFA
jgi:hypothetical protein